MQGNDIYNAATTVPFFQNPGANNVNLTNPSTSTKDGSTAALPFFASGLTNLAQTYKAPAVAQYSLGVQHELAPSLIWVVQYVGNLAWHQNIERNINNDPLSTPNGVRAAGENVQTDDGTVNGNPLATSGQGHIARISDSWRTFNGFSGINQQENTTNGSYNGFQTGVRIQNKWGLCGELDYTWSHEIDLTTYDLSGISNPWYAKYDKGSGFLDRRQMLSANYMYSCPSSTRATTWPTSSSAAGKSLVPSSMKPACRLPRSTVAATPPVVSAADTPTV